MALSSALRQPAGELLAAEEVVREVHAVLAASGGLWLGVLSYSWNSAAECADTGFTPVTRGLVVARSVLGATRG